MSEIEELESSLKATLQSLSLILAFYSSLKALSAIAYAPNAPRQYTQQLRAQSARFDETCDAIEKRLVRAIAVLERDARKLSGKHVVEPSPIVKTPALPADPSSSSAPAQSSSSFFGMDEDNGLGLNISLPPAATTSSPAEGDMEMDTSFLNDSLFGDSAAQTPEPDAPAEQTTSTAGEGATGTVLPAPEPDLAALLAMIEGIAPPVNQQLNASGSSGQQANNYSPLAPFSFPVSGGGAVGGVQPMDFSSLNFGDLSASMGGVGAFATAPASSSYDSQPAPAPNFDFSNLDLSASNFGEMDLDALLKSLQ